MKKWSGDHGGYDYMTTSGVLISNRKLPAGRNRIIDIAPTVLDAAGLVEPKFVNGVQQTPMQGVSMRYAFDDAAAGERHETQYFEMFGNRGIYHKGWTAVTRHGTPWTGMYKRAFDDDVWELYDTNKDWSQANNLAKQMPEKLRQLHPKFKTPYIAITVFSV